MKNAIYKILSVIVPDKMYLKMKFRLKMNKKLDLNQPKTFNEKLQWLKLNDRKDIYTIMVDKYEVKKYVANIIGEEHIIPTIGIYDKFDNIDFDKLPNQFVIKCTHDSGGLVIVKDKSKINIDKIRKKINKHLKRDYYFLGREWPYKNVQPRIIVEKYMSNNGKELEDYKIHNFNGNPKLILVCKDRYTNVGLTEDFFDENGLPRDPAELEEMVIKILRDRERAVRTGDRMKLGLWVGVMVAAVIAALWSRRSRKEE